MSLTYEVQVTKTAIRYSRHKTGYRNNGPSAIWKDGDMIWGKYGKIHRSDGPARIYGARNKKEYFFWDKRLTKEEYEFKICNLR